jgi:tetratricopeptide (TPR) repeat protein
MSTHTANGARVLNNLANEYADQNRADEVIGLQRRALAIEEKLSGPDSPAVARILTNLANSYKAAGRSSEASPLYEKAFRILTKRFGENSPQIAPALGNMGRVAQDNNKPVEAEQYFTQALQIDETAFGPEHPALVNDLRKLIDKNIDRPDRIILGQIVFESLGKQRALTAVIANDKARHRILPSKHRRIISLTVVFTQSGSKADLAARSASGAKRTLRSSISPQA